MANWNDLYTRKECEIPDFRIEGYWYGMMEVLKNVHLVYPKIRNIKNKSEFVEGWFQGYRCYWRMRHPETPKYRMLYPTLNLFRGIDPDYE